MLLFMKTLTLMNRSFESKMLREKLERASSIPAKFMGMPLSHSPPLLNQMHISPLELLHREIVLQWLPRVYCLYQTWLSLRHGYVSDDQHCCESVTAMDELLGRLHKNNEPMWTKTDRCLNVLNLKSFENAFPRLNSHGGKNHNLRVETTRSPSISSLMQ
ncbi:hypothetical protein HID58_074889 [Brassica napus]|uniref:Uncharacterized protein n=1 Tax=Brassica napus TaxID=3708 RepID=A0ABQ7YJR5_BRANA|nr:hypothetical protein HID58_074889 [Brassica napus]